MTDQLERVVAALARRFLQPVERAREMAGGLDRLTKDQAAGLTGMIGRGSCRHFVEDAVPDDLIQLICAAALSSPSKSDLQQRDIILVQDPGQRAALLALIDGEGWAKDAPVLMVFCGNNRRQRLLHDWQGLAFANDHLDTLFNAIADAAIVMQAAVTAAEALGLGCCPISAVRNEAERVAELLALPDHVFPAMGLALGWPASPAPISPRLPYAVTVHVDRYGEDDLRGAVQAYDAKRAEMQPYVRERYAADHAGRAVRLYGWSEDKARQYARPERAGFGAYLRRIGFELR